MNKILSAVALFFVFSLIFWGTGSFAQDEQGMVVYTEGVPYQVAGWNTFESSWLIGHQVWSDRDDLLGQISDCVIDQTNERIAMVILSDVPGFGAELVAVPYGSLVRTGPDSFQVSLSPREPIWRFDGEIGDAYRNVMSPGVVRAVIDSDWVASVYQHYGKTPYWTEGGQEPTMVLYRESRLIGTQVQTVQGAMVGKAYDLTIASADGHIAFLVLVDVPGRPETQIAIPFHSLSMQGEKVFVLNIPADKLAAAPSFNDAEDLTNRAYAENAYNFFGVQPYWTEEGGR